MRKVWSTFLLAAMVMSMAATAHAEPWDRGYRPVDAASGGYGWGGYGWGGHDRDDDARLNAVCSGATARMLEGRLWQEAREGAIDGDEANRLHAAIDRLEDKGRHECAEGDRGGIWHVARRYDRIGQTIGEMAQRRWGY